MQLGLKGTNAELAKSPVLLKKVKEELEKTAEQYEVRGFERVKEVYLESEIPGTLLTPTMKTKRAETAQHYKEVWKQLYKLEDLGL